MRPGGVNLTSVGIDGIRLNTEHTVATVNATCWFCSGDTAGWANAEVTDVSQRSLVLHKVGGRWLVWLDNWPPIGDLMSSRIPLAMFREQLQRALPSGPHGPLERVYAAPPAAISAMEDYFAAVNPRTFSGATRAAFLWAFKVAGSRMVTFDTDAAVPRRLLRSLGYEHLRR